MNTTRKKPGIRIRGQTVSDFSIIGGFVISYIVGVK